ncbi:proline-rich receptor-like protein kinase perk8 [Fagus crenata]
MAESTHSRSLLSSPPNPPILRVQLLYCLRRSQGAKSGNIYLQFMRRRRRRRRCNLRCGDVGSGGFQASLAHVVGCRIAYNAAFVNTKRNYGIGGFGKIKDFIYRDMSNTATASTPVLEEDTASNEDTTPIENLQEVEDIQEGIVRLFEEPEHWLKMQKERDESLHENSSTSTGESSQWRQDYSASNEAVDYF